MSKTTKTYKDYNEYLNSPKWTQVKKDFYEYYEGYDDVCEISGDSVDELNLHHWNYESDWNNDHHKNLILVCREVHEWLHAKTDDISIHSILDTTSMKRYLCDAICQYHSEKRELNEVRIWQQEREIKSIKEDNSSSELLVRKVDIYKQLLVRYDERYNSLRNRMIEVSPFTAEVALGLFELELPNAKK